MTGNINCHLLQPRGGAIEQRFEAIGLLCFLHDQEELPIDLVGLHGWTGIQKENQPNQNCRYVPQAPAHARALLAP